MSVKLVNVSKIFDESGKVVAVDHVNLEVNEGELVTFLGPSGCGKTTTLRIVSGFETPTEGEVWIGGKMVNNDPPNKRDTSMVFQSYAIFPHMSVEQNIAFGLELKNVSPPQIAERVEEIVSVMDLKQLLKRRPDQLSGGQQQRVALARAIINRPKVLLFDEPLSNLDAKLRDQMRFEIRRIQKQFGITSIYVTHDQIEAMTVSDRIMVMDKGRICQISPPQELYSKPATRFVADFIGRVNFLEGRAVKKTADTLTVSVAGHELICKSFVQSIVEGKIVSIVVRPESLKLAAAKTSQAEKDSLFTGTVEKSVYLGSTVEYEISAQGIKPLTAVVSDPLNSGVFSGGEKLSVDIYADTVHVIPAE